MIRLVRQGNAGIAVADSADRVKVYLDTWSFPLLARSAALRAKFVDFLVDRGDLGFSWTNALELSRCEGQTVRDVSSLLAELGPHWTPIELNPFAAIRKEQSGKVYEAPVSMDLCAKYYNWSIQRMEQKPSLDKFSDELLSLSRIHEWATASNTRDMLDACHRDLDGVTENYWKAAAPPQSGFDQFEPTRPVTWVFCRLGALLHQERKAFQRRSNDGADFCHAVLSIATADVATLDKQWMRRGEAIIEETGSGEALARIFGPNELEAMVQFLVTEARPRLLQ